MPDNHYHAHLQVGKSQSCDDIVSTHPGEKECDSGLSLQTGGGAHRVEVGLQRPSAIVSTTQANNRFVCKTPQQSPTKMGILETSSKGSLGGRILPKLGWGVPLLVSANKISVKSIKKDLVGRNSKVNPDCSSLANSAILSAVDANAYTGPYCPSVLGVLSDLPTNTEATSSARGASSNLLHNQGVSQCFRNDLGATTTLLTNASKDCLANAIRPSTQNLPTCHK